MRTDRVFALALSVGLLLTWPSGADADCGLQIGDRVQLTVDHPDGNPTLWRGMRGTVVCFDEGHWMPVLVTWDAWSDGHSNDWFCTTPHLPYRPGSCWWVCCFEIGPIPPFPELYDAGESYRSFSPQRLVAGDTSQRLEVKARVGNGGEGEPSESIYVNFYASKDRLITKSDHYLGNTNCYISPAGEMDLTRKMTFPASIPPGLYYVGWIIDPDNRINEIDERNNTAYVSSYRLLVSAADWGPSLVLSAAKGGRIAAPGEGVFPYSHAQDVLVQAVPDPNNRFLRWTGTAVDRGNVTDPGDPTTHVWVDQPCSLTAVFGGAHLVIEDFEIYGEPNHPISGTWIDGLGFLPGDPQGNRGNGTGAITGISEEPTLLNPTVHGGMYSMVFEYSNDLAPWYSETERIWGRLQNWTATGADRLSIWYRGAPDNHPAPLYVIVEDYTALGHEVVHPDPDVLRTGEWRRWDIPLTEFEGAGVMLSRVVKMMLGVGSRDEFFFGGKGTFYIDDIVLGVEP